MKKPPQQHRSASSSCSAHRVFLLFLGQSLVVFAFVSFILHHHVQLEKEYQAVQSQLQQFHILHQGHQQQHGGKDTAATNSTTAVSSSSSSSPTPPTPPSRSILFVHVGKTGGETVKKVLRIGCEVRKNVAQQAHCWEHDFDVAHESKLSQLVHGYFHYRQMHPRNAALVATHYLYTLRHPVQRLQSWFRYISPINCPIPLEVTRKNNNNNTSSMNVAAMLDDPVLNRMMACRNRQTVLDRPDSWEARFFACFPTLEFMAQGLAVKNDSTRCSRMLRHVLNGQGGSGGGDTTTGQDVVGHLAANYQYYHRHTIGLSMSSLPSSSSHANATTNNNRTVLVLRTESLWEDLKELDIFLGGNGYFRKEGLRVSHLHKDQQPQHDQHKAEEVPVQQVLYKDAVVLSPQGGKLLCCEMHEELAIYRELLLRAVNLNATQQRATLAAALELCRATSWSGLVQACGMQKSKLLLLDNVDAAVS
jgi:Sulfotransferase family